MRRCEKCGSEMRWTRSLASSGDDDVLWSCDCPEYLFWVLFVLFFLTMGVVSFL